MVVVQGDELIVSVLSVVEARRYCTVLYCRTPTILKGLLRVLPSDASSSVDVIKHACALVVRVSPSSEIPFEGHELLDWSKYFGCTMMHVRRRNSKEWDVRQRLSLTAACSAAL